MARSMVRDVVSVVVATGMVMALAGATSAAQSVRRTCRAAAAAANEFQDAARNVDRAGADRAIRAFGRIERNAPDDLPRELSSQLRLVARTLSDLPEDAPLRRVRLANARLTHGLTGVMLACDRAGVRVTMEY